MEKIDFKVNRADKYSDEATKIEDINTKNNIIEEYDFYTNTNKYSLYSRFDEHNGTKDRLADDKDVFNIENKKINLYNEKTESLDINTNDFSSNEKNCSINNNIMKNFSNDLKKNKNNNNGHAFIDAYQHINEYKDFYELKIEDYPKREHLYIERDELSVSAGSIAKIEEISEKNNSHFFRNIFGRRN